MFFDILSKLCTEKGISVTQLTTILGISKSNVTNWKNGSIPKSDKIQEIASYFGVSTDYLLGNDTKSKTPIDDDDIKFALFSGHDEITDEMFDEVRNFAKFVAEREMKKKKNESK
ncbi:MAG: helix-turn-helix transcriptional regulator [Clostridiaceae bacterium]|nr:helix-turn-helix transcriptional regulator [Clostridiaceae bacterium]